jgi:hypothetical protein
MSDKKGQSRRSFLKFVATVPIVDSALKFNKNATPSPIVKPDPLAPSKEELAVVESFSWSHTPTLSPGDDESDDFGAEYGDEEAEED